MDSAVQHLLSIRAIQQMPVDQIGQGFYSLVFLVPKTLEVWSPFLDLKRLNHYVVYHKFKMQSLRTILGVRKGNLLTSINFTEAYLHIPILPSHRRFLRFCYAGGCYQYRALPFGFPSLPIVLPKC